ncbi:MAG: NAD(P)H-dependent oxidoreductase subunit E [Actinobacteria bacterium]|nr:NAD(P)H-dependent oxidoreductase subunit E [Actinomycetota bacterium]MBU1944983.1 NAD(P)H-dependent oxidoreductase subunit E [Actinomycetota bacterium]MBU2688464.1 NAD(P)H-dependent oxidoreductase subunit E [Actinomycetota bacterium]
MEVEGPGSVLIERLLEENDRKGFLQAAAVEKISIELGVPASRVRAVAGQLRHFRFAPGPDGVTAICRGPACELAGSSTLVETLGTHADVPVASLLGSPYWHEPILAVVPGREGAAVSRKVEADAVSPDELARAPRSTSAEPATDLISGRGGILGGLGARRTKAAYLKSHAAELKRYLDRTSSTDVLERIRASRIVETMTGHEVADMVDSVRASAGGSAMIVCDTGGVEPENDAGPVLAWLDPMGVIEGVLIAARAAGARRALVFVPYEHGRLVQAFERVVDAVAGVDIQPSVELALLSGPNLIPCDREIGIAALYHGLTLSEAVSRARASSAGLWGGQTLVSGAEVFLRLSRLARGSGRTPASRVISVGGCVNSPCVAEAPLTATPADLVAASAGGLREGSVLKAIHFGGVFGGPLRPVALKSRLRSLFGRLDGTGSGQMLLIDRGTCMVAWSEYFTWLGERLCCGACVAGRLGPACVRRLIGKITAGNGDMVDLEEIRATIELMRETSLCPQGGKVLNAVGVALENFYSEFEEHVTEKKCAAGVCRLSGD